MFLAEPPRTQFDLHFGVWGFPVRIHPLFWVVSLLMGANLARGQDAAINLVIWIGVVFVSILVHELGHAFAMRHHGQNARVVLYWLGGLAIPDVSPYASAYARKPDPWAQVRISAAGPAAGFVLAGFVIALVYALGGHVAFKVTLEDFLYWEIDLDNNHLATLVHCLLFANIYWGLMNLLPVFPLDGGQIARELLSMQDPQAGLVRSLWLSVLTGSAVAAYGLVQLARGDGSHGFFLALLFGSLAFQSFQILQSFSGRGRW